MDHEESSIEFMVHNVETAMVSSYVYVECK